MVSGNHQSNKQDKMIKKTNRGPQLNLFNQNLIITCSTTATNSIVGLQETVKDSHHHHNFRLPSIHKFLEESSNSHNHLKLKMNS